MSITYNLNEERFILAHGFLKFQSIASWPQGRKAIVEGPGQRKAAYPMVTRNQRAKEGAREGDISFQATPEMIHLFSPSPTS